jgi:aspartyl-tRNA(Asn)/glutamyl-tRNA(Gln) amidotransferase subunit B
LKNLNSFRFVEKAINFEIERQIDVIEDGGKVVQETRLYDSDKDETRSMRTKEEANDYRYFPDPDLLPVEISAEYVDAVRETLPELPDAKQQRFVDDYGIREDDAAILTVSRAMADYFEAVIDATQGKPQGAANFVIGDLSGALNRDGLDIEQSPVSATDLAQLLDRIKDNTISGKIAKEVFEAMWAGEGSADEIIEAKGLKQITDSSAIEAIVDKVIEANPGQVAEYKAGKDKLIGYFVGQVMKETGGKANPGQVNAILKAKLG